MSGHSRELADFTTDRRVLALSAIAVFIGVIASFIAVILLDLIQFFTNLCFYGRFSISTSTPIGNHLGPG